MGSHTIIDEVQALVDGLVITGGGMTATFPWIEWEEQEEARGPLVTADLEDAELNVSDIGGGAQASLEFVRLRFYWENDARATIYAQWKNELVKDVLAAIRGNEKGFTGGYFVEVQNIEFDRRRLDPNGMHRAASVFANLTDFLLVARRHDVY